MSIESGPTGIAMEYNGLTFPTNMRTKVSEEPMQSGDNRQVKYSKLTISVSGFITQTEADALELADTMKFILHGLAIRKGDYRRTDGEIYQEDEISKS